MSDKPELEKYDRFEYCGECVVEYTGMHYNDGEVEIVAFRIIQSDNPRRQVDDIVIAPRSDLPGVCFKKLPPPLNHPVVLEAARLTRDKPEIRAQFARALATQFNASDHAQKLEIIELLRKALPIELRNALIRGYLCGQCLECSKRIWRVDNA